MTRRLEGGSVVWMTERAITGVITESRDPVFRGVVHGYICGFRALMR